MSFFCEPPVPTSNCKSSHKPASGRPTKLTPEVLSILAGLLDSGLPESPGHLLKLLSERGVPMSRPTVFKAIDKLGRNGSIRWRRNYYGMHHDPDINMSNGTSRDVRGQGVGISSLEKYVFADTVDTGVLDLRVSPGLCNQPFLQKPSLPQGGENVTKSRKEEGFRYPSSSSPFSMIRVPQSETNAGDIECDRRQTNNVPPAIAEDRSQITVPRSNENASLSSTDHATDHQVSMKEEYLSVPADSTISPRSNNSATHSPPFSFRIDDPIRPNTNGTSSAPGSSYRQNSHVNAALANYAEWVNKTMAVKAKRFAPMPEDRDLWLFHHDQINDRIPSLPLSPTGGVPPPPSPAHRRQSSSPRLEMYSPPHFGSPPLGSLSSMYPNGRMTSSPPRHNSTSPKVRPSFLQSARLKPYEVRPNNGSPQLFGNDSASRISSSSTSSASEKAPTLNLNDKDANLQDLTVVLQEVVLRMQNISHRLETLEHQVQCFTDAATHSKGYTYTPGCSPSSPSPGSCFVDDADAKSNAHNSEKPRLNTPESEALISEIVNDCHWDQWRPFAGAPRLAIKLAKDCIFGTNVLLESTVTGRSCKNPLDKRGLDKIRGKLFLCHKTESPSNLRVL